MGHLRSAMPMLNYAGEEGDDRERINGAVYC